MRVVPSVCAALAAGAVLTFVAQPSAAGPQDEAPLDITFIIHCCEGNVFWEPMIHAVREAEELFNVRVDIQNADGDPERNANLIETAIANKVDGIVPMLSVDDALTDSIQKAVDAGIVVIAANIDDPDGTGPGGSSRMAFVGQDFIASGARIGKRMIEQHGLKAGDHCVSPVEQPDLVYAHQRFTGVKNALDVAGVTVEVIGTGTGNADENQSIIAEYLVANPETDCAIALSGVPLSVLPQAAEEAGLKGLANGGFDINDRVMDNINGGMTTATMDQQPFWQAFLPIMFIAYNVRYGLAPGDVDTGMGMVDKASAAVATERAGTYR